MKLSFAEPKQQPDANEKNADRTSNNTSKDNTSADKDSKQKEEDISQELDFMRKDHHERHWHF